MLNNFLLGRYILKDSIVHKLNPVFKILSLIIMFISLPFVNSYIDLLILFFYLLLVISYSDINIKIYLKNILSLRLLLLVALIINLIFFTSIDMLIFHLFKIIFIILYLSILTLTTAMTEINYGISKILSPLSDYLPINRFALIVTVILRYIEVLTIEANRIINNQKLRGVEFNTKNLKDKVTYIIGAFLPTFTLAYKRSHQITEMMELRLYGYGKSRTNYRLNKWAKRDSFLLTLNILILSIVIFY